MHTYIPNIMAIFPMHVGGAHKRHIYVLRPLRAIFGEMISDIHT